MDYKKILDGSKGLKTVRIQNKNYVEVNQRIIAFRTFFPEGRIETIIVEQTEDSITFRALIYDGDKLLATGHANEEKASSRINNTSYVENCETSAIGRALGILGIGIEDSIATYEEVQNAINNQNKEPNLSVEVLEQAKALNLNFKAVAAYFKKTVDQLTDKDVITAIQLKQNRGGNQ